LRALTLTATGSLDHLRLQDLPAPPLEAPDQVRVRVHSAALNRLDLWVIDGLPGVEYRFPRVIGADGAGVVLECGADVTRVRPGDRVMINPGISCGQCEWCRAGEHPLCPDFQVLGEHRDGTIAEQIVVPERNLASVPAGMSWSQAAGFPLATLTAWRMLTTRARLVAGEQILIWGIGGGVALAALAIARHLGASAVVTSSSPAKLARARALGAEVTLNHATQDVAREVRALTSRRGVNVVVDSVGQKTWEQSLRCLGRLGRLVTCGGTSGPMVTTDVRKLFWYQWSILGSTMGNEAEFRQVVELAGQGLLWPEIDTVFPLDRSREAFERLQAGEQLGKVVIEVAR
jgi:NADPH:quinone reductase-like Zn-dependent oxidoreductase